MAYPVRQFDPQTVYFVTSRTLQSRLLMAPSAKTNELIGGILARAVRQCGAELFAFVFTSNHFHLMVRAPSHVAMSRFMQQLQGNIGVKVGRFVGWRGRFFGRRYSAEPIVDDEAQVERLRYILSHGVKEGLVSEVRRWPGLSCARALLENQLSTPHRWRNWTQRWRVEVREGVKVGRFSEECPSEPELLTLSPLPAWREHSEEERARLVAQIVADIDAAARNRDPAAARRIAAQHPHGRPQWTKHAPRPKAHASTRERWLEAIGKYRAFLEQFRAASRRWLAGVFDAEFPRHSFRPPTWSVTVQIV